MRAQVNIGSIKFELIGREKNVMRKAFAISSPRGKCDNCGNTRQFHFDIASVPESIVKMECNKCGAFSDFIEFNKGQYHWLPFTGGDQAKNNEANAQVDADPQEIPNENAPIVIDKPGEPPVEDIDTAKDAKS